MPDTTSAGTPPTDGQDAQSGAQGAPGGDAPWTPPASQQDLDRIIQDRLSRERAKYTDYEELKTKAGEYDKHVAATRSKEETQAAQIAELTAKVSAFESEKQVAAWRAEVATATGVPVEVLTGSTLADIQAYADKLKPLLATTTAAPAAGPYAPALGTGAGTPPATDTTPGRGTLAAAFAASTKK